MKREIRWIYMSGAGDPTRVLDQEEAAEMILLAAMRGTLKDHSNKHGFDCRSGSEFHFNLDSLNAIFGDRVGPYEEVP